MKYLKKKFLLSQSIHPELGSYIHLCQAIRESGINRRTILRLFNELIPLEEYDKSEKVELIDYLEIQSKK